MEYRELNNGTSIPEVGIGVFMLTPDEAQASVESALADGYQLVDTANAYMNERAVGRAIAASGKAREDLYISTKLWPSVYADADKAIDDTLARLGLDYVDLLFLHQPVGDYIGAYKAMERAVAAGKVKSLGLSNFSKEQIQEVIEATEIVPAVVQVEAHPYFQQADLRAFLEPKGIAIMAWYPLGHGDKSLVQEAVIGDIAKKYGKSNAQVILRWHTQKGNIVIPGSKNPEHIKANIDIFDFTLTPEEMASIDALDKNIPYYVGTKEALQGYLAWAPDFNAQP
jgi:diketogulonate reductase-like aldo/keto reductase